MEDKGEFVIVGGKEARAKLTEVFKLVDEGRLVFINKRGELYKVSKPMNKEAYL
jgi:hypothetical protein